MAPAKPTPNKPSPLAPCPLCDGLAVKRAHTQSGSLHELFCTCANKHSFSIRWTDAA